MSCPSYWNGCECDSCRERHALLEYQRIVARAANRKVQSKISVSQVAFVTVVVLFTVGFWADFILRLVRR